MQQKLLLLLYVACTCTLLTNCTGKDDRDNNSEISKINTPYHVNLDSIELKKLEEIDHQVKNNVLDTLKLLKFLNGDFKAYQLNKKRLQEHVGLFVYVNRDSYSGVLLLIYNKDGKLISSKEVAGGECAGPYEESNFVHWCNEKYAEFYSDSAFVEKVIFKKSDDYNSSNLYVDTVANVYQIKRSGEIAKISSKKESIIRQLDEGGAEIP